MHPKKDRVHCHLLIQNRMNESSHILLVLKVTVLFDTCYLSQNIVSTIISYFLTDSTNSEINLGFGFWSSLL